MNGLEYPIFMDWFSSQYTDNIIFYRALIIL